MLSTTVAKIKKVCSIILIPRIIQGETKNGTLKPLCKNSLYGSRANKTTKSTDINQDNLDPNNNTKANIQSSVNDDDIKRSVAMRKEIDCEICNHLINQIFNIRQNQYESQTAEHEKEEAIVQATTSKEDEEQLVQKVEKLQEHASFEAAPQLENPNVAPTVLGQQHILDMSHRDNFNDIDYDAVASRCLDAPPNKVDERILNELKKERAAYLRNNEKLDQVEFDETLKTCTYTEKGITDYPIATEHYYLATDVEEQCTYKDERIQPLLLDSVTLYAMKNEDFQSMIAGPSMLKPYDYQSIKFYDYVFNEVEVEEEQLMELKEKGFFVEDVSTLTEPSVSPKDNVTMSFYDYSFKNNKPLNMSQQEQKFIGNNQVIPPAEADLEFETCSPGAISQFVVEGTGDLKTNESGQISHNTGYLYVKKDHSSEVPPEGESLDHKFEIQVKPNTSISGQRPPDKNQQIKDTSNTAISANQSPDEHFKQFISADFQDNNEMQDIAWSSKTESLEKEKLNVNCEMSNEFIDKRELLANFIFDSPERSQNETNDKFLRTQATNIESKITTVTGPLSDLSNDDTLSLKELLRKVRRRHQLEFCQNFLKDYTFQFVQPNQKCKDSDKKAPCPLPCKPKAKEECPPPPPKCPDKKKDPCAPKSPCAKFISSLPFEIPRFLSGLSEPPMINYQRSYSTLSSPHYSENRLKTALSCGNNTRKIIEVNDYIFPKNFEPWTPIPSWPIPKKKINHPLVCPKEGCKEIPPPHPNERCRPNAPCRSFPKRTFSLSELL
ncbi:uncharacterized protein LOC126973584 [Leptidea sinapis]|uniref:uncharacterized protein LOC126973584 n=1 Tax=Leptidea sinapis TaxID=189913 RepID=UPI0021C4367F|nr:uncharacterized protein LOC126973584 [Leptidea sinapis]